MYGPKTGSIRHVLEALRQPLAGILRDSMVPAHIRVLEVQNHRLVRDFSEDDSVATLAENTVLHAMEIPGDELAKRSGDMVVPVMHFNRDLARAFGVPFKFVLRAGEPLSGTKARLKELLRAGDKDFSKWRFAVVSFMEVSGYLEDDAEVLAQRDWKDADLLGLDHVDRSGRSQERGHYERAIKIHN